MNSNHIYQKRLNLVIDYISLHLNESFSLERMAEIAGFSSFYFHRIFFAIFGETPADYVNRVRLETAASRLTKTRRPVTQIAYECGFSDPSNFVRAFRKFYGITPSEYRSGEELRPPAAAIPNHPLIENNPQFLLNSPCVKQFQDIPVVYLASYKGYDVKEINHLWGQLYGWGSERNLIRPDTLHIGISMDDPLITNFNKGRYYACISVPPGTKAFCPFNSMIIPGLRYAVFHAECKSEDLPFVFHQIFHDWLPASGYQPSDSYPLEIYLCSAENHPWKLTELQICIPVERINE